MDDGVLDQVALEVEEEERPVPENRTADVEAEGVLAAFRLGLACRLGEGVVLGESTSRLFRLARRDAGSSPGGYLRQQYAAASDGQRFLALVDTPEAAVPPITIVLNWVAGLKK